MKGGSTRQGRDTHRRVRARTGVEEVQTVDEGACTGLGGTHDRGGGG
jgi:hypothetical protein